MKDTVEFKDLDIEEILKRKPLVTFDGKYITVSEKNSYHIEKSRCDSHAKICGWIQHLGQKNWVTSELLVEFVNVAQDAAGLEDVYRAGL